MLLLALPKLGSQWRREAGWCIPFFLLNTSVPRPWLTFITPMGPKYFLCTVIFLLQQKVTYHRKRNYWLVVDEKQTREPKMFQDKRKRNRLHGGQLSISSNTLFALIVPIKTVNQRSVLLRWVSPDTKRIFFAVHLISVVVIRYLEPASPNKTLYLSHASSSAKLLYVVLKLCLVA